MLETVTVRVTRDDTYNNLSAGNVQMCKNRALVQAIEKLQRYCGLKLGNAVIVENVVMRQTYHEEYEKCGCEVYQVEVEVTALILQRKEEHYYMNDFGLKDNIVRIA